MDCYYYDDSPPVSPSSTTSEDSECSNATSSASPAGGRKQSFVNRKPKFPTKYHELLQPLSPVITLPVEHQHHNYLYHNSRAAKVNDSLQAEFFDLVRGSSLANVEAFLRQHVDEIDVNRFDREFGQTPLHEACQMGHLELAKLLVRYGATARLANRDGFSLLHLAAFSGNPQLISFVSGLPR